MSDKHDPQTWTTRQVIYLCPDCSAEARFRCEDADAADYGVEMVVDRCGAAMDAWLQAHLAKCPATIPGDDEWGTDRGNP